jgi:hypothetical protein
MSKIFVSIASYRDPELLPTLKNLLENCAEPENLHVCIGWQHSDEDEWDNLNEYVRDSRFTILDINHKDSMGVCWVRSKIQEFYKDEDYYFQLDSHHRFEKNWDTILKDYVNLLKCKGFKKPVVSAYVPGYFPETDPENRVQEVWGLNIMRFLPEGAVFLQPYHVDRWQDLKEPIPARFVSGHFIFTIGKFVKEVPYDPYFYFHGEETSLSARAYTHGYDLFAPHRPIVWHEYTRKGKQRHWDDHKSYNDLDRASYARFRKLFEMDDVPCTPCQRKALAHYGFGEDRSLQQYEKYAGLKFKTRQIHQETLENKLPPIKGDYESGLVHKRKICIDLYKGALIEGPDYDSFAIAILDEEGKDMYRQDMTAEEMQSLRIQDPDDQFIHIWRDFESAYEPYSWRIWPHSISEGWLERIENKINHQ